MKKSIFKITIIMLAIASNICAQTTEEVYEFGGTNVYYYIYLGGKTWEFEARNNMIIHTIEVKSILASREYGGTFNIEVSIEDSLVAKWSQYINDVYFKPYYHTKDISYEILQGDKIVYKIYGGSYSSFVGGIKGVNYVKLIGGSDQYPALAVTPESFKETVEQGGLLTRTFNISNHGEGELHFTLGVRHANPPNAAGMKTDHHTRIIGLDVPAASVSSSMDPTIKLDYLKEPVKREEAVFEKSARIQPQSAVVYDDKDVIHYDSENDGALGLKDGGTFHVAARFTPEELSDYYDEYSIEKVLVYIKDQPSDAQIEIWEGGSLGNPGNKVYEQSFFPPADSWYEYELAAPIPLINGKEYWIGYRVTHDADKFSAGCDEGPMVANKGGWINENGSEWNQIADLDLNYNWNIRGILGLNLTWISFDSAAGTVQPGNNTNITVTFDATDLEPDVRYANILISSNDPENPVVTVPVELTVNKEMSIIASTDDNGSIVPSGEVEVEYDHDQVFTITPDEGFRVAYINIDGNEINLETDENWDAESGQYTFSNVTEAHTIEVGFENTNAIDDVATKNELKVYPNPAKNELWIEFNYQGSDRPLIILQNMQGQTVKQNRVNETGSIRQRMSTHNLASGIYLLAVKCDQEFPVKKVVIEN